MKRIVLFVLFLVLVAGLVLPFWGGIEARRVYEDAVARMDTYGGSRLHARSEDYTHGWLQSVAHTRFWTEGMDPEQGVRIDHTIHHGPYPFTLLIGGELRPGAVAAVVDTDWTPASDDDDAARLALEGTPLIRMRSVVEIDGSMNVTFHSPAFSVEQPPFEWRGIEGEMQLRPGMEEGHGELQVRGFDMDLEKIRLEVGTLDADFEANLTDDGVPVGDMNVHLEHAYVANGKPLLSVVDARFEQAYGPNEESGLLDVSFSSSVEEVSKGEETYGPGVIEVEFRNLDSEAMRAYRDALAEADPDDPESARAVDEAIAELWPALLRSGPEAKIVTLRLAMPEGELDATGEIRMDPSAANLPPAMAVAGLRGTLSIGLPPRLLNQIVDRQVARMKGIELDEAAGAAIVEIAATRTDWIEQLVAADLLELDGDTYRVDLEYEGSQLLVNGRPFDLSSLSVLMPSAP